MELDGTAVQAAVRMPMIPPEIGCRVREVLERVGDKWSVNVICNLGEGARRFTELRKDVDGISQRMLTVTLRGLERDGLIDRRVYPVVPPRVEYSLTPLGRTLLCTVAPLLGWAAEHLHDIDVARVTYDKRQEQPEFDG